MLVILPKTSFYRVFCHKFCNVIQVCHYFTVRMKLFHMYSEIFLIPAKSKVTLTTKFTKYHFLLGSDFCFFKTTIVSYAPLTFDIFMVL